MMYYEIMLLQKVNELNNVFNSNKFDKENVEECMFTALEDFDKLDSIIHIPNFIRNYKQDISIYSTYLDYNNLNKFTIYCEEIIRASEALKSDNDVKKILKQMITSFDYIKDILKKEHWSLYSGVIVEKFSEIAFLLQSIQDKYYYFISGAARAYEILSQAVDKELSNQLQKMVQTNPDSNYMKYLLTDLDYFLNPYHKILKDREEAKLNTSSDKVERKSKTSLEKIDDDISFYNNRHFIYGPVY